MNPPSTIPRDFRIGFQPTSWSLSGCRCSRPRYGLIVGERGMDAADTKVGLYLETTSVPFRWPLKVKRWAVIYSADNAIADHIANHNTSIMRRITSTSHIDRRLVLWHSDLDCGLMNRLHGYDTAAVRRDCTRVRNTSADVSRRTMSTVPAE